MSVESVDVKDLYLDRLPTATRRAFLACIHWPLWKQSGWYLAGGTALALQAGHRQSVDLDFFTTKNKFSERTVERMLLATGEWQTTYLENGTIYGVFMGAKMSLIAYPFFSPSKNEKRCGTMRLLSPEDIAAMKIVAISQRGRKRDFVDLYWYCQNRDSLASVVLRAMSQYPGQEKNTAHIIKSLSYFDDAEEDPMPTLFFRATWADIKQFFRQEVIHIVDKLFFR